MPQCPSDRFGAGAFLVRLGCEEVTKAMRRRPSGQTSFACESLEPLVDRSRRDPEVCRLGPDAAPLGEGGEQRCLICQLLSPALKVGKNECPYFRPDMDFANLLALSMDADRSP